MTTAEVINALEALGVVLSDDTLRRWAKVGLVPEPITGSRGRGLGRYSEYSTDTVFEAFAAYHLIKEYVISIKYASEIRKKAKSFLAEFMFYDFSDYVDDIHRQCELDKQYIVEEYSSSEGSQGHYDKPSPSEYEILVGIDLLILKWIMLKFKAQNKISVDSLLRVYITLNNIIEIVDNEQLANIDKNNIVEDSGKIYKIDFRMRFYEYKKGEYESELVYDKRPDGSILIEDDYYYAFCDSGESGAKVNLTAEFVSGRKSILKRNS